jgi:hypothetical protein
MMEVPPDQQQRAAGRGVLQPDDLEVESADQPAGEEPNRPL